MTTMSTLRGKGYLRHGRLLLPASVVPARRHERPVDLVPVATPAEPAEPLPVPVDQAPVVEPVSAQPDGRPDEPTGPVESVESVEKGRGRRRESADELEARLAEERRLANVQRDDALERRWAVAEHRDDMADVDADSASRARRRAEAARDEAAQADLAALYRRAAKDGERARIRADIQRSAEMRALRIAAVQRSSLWGGLPILLGFAAWSTTGVQAGMVRLLGLEPYSAGWWAAWIVEPLLIAIVAGIIVVKAVLNMSGGKTDWRANLAEWGALGTSVALNLFGGWRGGDWMSAAGEALAHSIGAIGAAVTAWLIGVVIDYASKATPWLGADRLADMGLWMPGPEDARTPIRRGKRGLETVDPEALPDAVRKVLAATKTAIESGDLPADPSAYAIYKNVMDGKGDRDRSRQVALLVAGWRPESQRGLRAV